MKSQIWAIIVIMELPIYDNIVLESDDYYLVESKILGQFNSRTPFIIHIKHHFPEVEHKIIQTIEKVFEDHQLMKAFPYPCYIVCNSLDPSSSLYYFKQVQHLPDFFNKRRKRPNVKEMSYLNKNFILLNKFTWQSFQEWEKNRMVLSANNKELYQQSKAQHFYQRLKQNLGI